MKATNILEKAAQHMRDRAATYDKPEGERSMGKTVAAFNAITGRDQLERIESRIYIPKFIARVGREKRDAMFEVLKQEETGGLE